MPIRKLIICFLIILFAQGAGYAQKRNNIWVFGYHAGLDFNTSPPTPLDSTMVYGDKPPHYVSGISDKDGKLQFYTNGWAVWNKDNQIIPKTKNYWPWGGEVMPLVVPYPDNDSLYYLFGISTKEFSYQFQYLTINMNGRDGQGAIVYPSTITTTNYFTVLSPNASMMVAGTAHCNGKDIWVVNHTPGQLNAYLVTKDGVRAAPVSTSIGSDLIPAQLIHGRYSNIKFSANGEKIAVPAPAAGKVLIMDFDNLSGRFSNPMALNLPRLYELEDIELSPDGSKLYIGAVEHTEIDPGVPGASLHQMMQMDLDAGDQQAIEQSLYYLALPDRSACSPKRCTFYNRTLQLGPDGKIYVSSHVLWPDHLTYDNTANVIHYPDKKGPNAFYRQDVVKIGRKYKFINYNYIRSGSFTMRENGIKVQKKSCYDQPVDFALIFNKIDSVRWNFGDPASGENNTSNSFTPKHQYPAPGTYTVKAVVYSRCLSDTAITQIVIDPIQSVKIPDHIKDTFGCVGEKLVLDALTPAATNYIWDNGLIYSKRTFDTAGRYSITVFNECSIDRRELKVVYKECPCQVHIPNAFTPNNDGINDNFKPVVECLAKDYQFRIYNRYGGVTFESTEPNKGWNGKLGIKEAPSGVYLWSLQYSNPNTRDVFVKHGTVVLIR
jgi:gliding motility-associated-like protein